MSNPVLPTFEEREPYEKGFSAHYQKHIVPVLIELEKTREEKRALYKSRMVKALPIAGVAALLVLGISISIELDPRIPFGIIALIVTLAWSWVNIPLKQYKDAVKSRFIPPICSFFGELNYQESGSSFMESNYSGEVFPGFDRCYQEDFIEGNYRSISMHVHESILTRRVKTKHGSHDITVFRGLVLQIKPPKQFVGKTLLIKDGGSIGNFFTGKEFHNLQRVELEDPEFEKIFQVFSSDQLEARYLLSTAFMEHLIKLARLRSPNGTPQIQCVFEKDQLIIAIPSQQNLFEPQSINHSILNSEDIHTFLAQMQEIFNLIEVLFPKSLKKL